MDPGRHLPSGKIGASAPPLRPLRAVHAAPPPRGADRTVFDGPPKESMSQFSCAPRTMFATSRIRLTVPSFWMAASGEPLVPIPVPSVPQALHDDLLLIEDLVRDKSRQPSHRVFDDKHDALVDRLSAREVELVVEAHERQQIASEVQDLSPARHGEDLVGIRTERRMDAQRRNDVALPGDADRHAADDGERERKADREAGSAAFGRPDVDGPAQRFDVALDHVHSDTAPPICP